jgi:hypothetical protein
MNLRLRLPTRLEENGNWSRVIEEDYVVNVSLVEQGSKVGKGYTYTAIVKEEDFPDDVRNLLSDDAHSWFIRQNNVYGVYLRAHIDRKNNKQFKTPQELWTSNGGLRYYSI